MPGLVPGIHVFAAGQGVDGRDKRGHGSSPRREMMRRIWQSWALTLALLVAGAVGQPSRADDSGRLLRLDHYVGVRSTVPAISGQMTEIYVREVVSARSLRDGVAANRVVLFVHGAGTPAEVSFDVPYRDYSWMEYLARAGFDVFGMDNAGYGRSTRPSPMNDPCNLQDATMDSSERRMVAGTWRGTACVVRITAADALG
jgi:alpha-beta hydrolase superfamily lysophospholipase